jgi:hypothetical protein
MQAEIMTRTCDNPSCAGTGGSAPSPTVETITNGTTNRPDLNWFVGAAASRSADNTQLRPGALKQFCQASCVTAVVTALAGGSAS